VKNLITILLLSGIVASVAIAGYIEVTVPHPAPGECQGCWIEHGFGTTKNLQDYGMIVFPVITGMASFMILVYIHIIKSRRVGVME
jgi:hypothetical protein